MSLFYYATSRFVVSKKIILEKDDWTKMCSILSQLRFV